MYAARTRSGFTPAVREQLHQRFRGLEAPVCPFANPTAGAGRKVGRGSDGREDERLPVARAGPGRAVRVCGVDAGYAPKAFAVRWIECGEEPSLDRRAR